MPGIEHKPPTDEQVAKVRQRFQDYITEHGKDVFDELDIKRVMTEDFYVHRWFMHVFDAAGDQIDACVRKMTEALIWRKAQNVRGITTDTLSPVLKEKGSFYMKNEDKDGCPLLVFAMAIHKKGESPALMKQHFLYYLERIDRETKGGKMSLVFQCVGCGVTNMDMELIQYIIKCLDDYFPYNLNYILVIDMSWLLQLAGKSSRVGFHLQESAKSST